MLTRYRASKQHPPLGPQSPIPGDGRVARRETPSRLAESILLHSFVLRKPDSDRRKSVIELPFSQSSSVAILFAGRSVDFYTRLPKE